jgi:predicted metalloendopeptidase
MFTLAGVPAAQAATDAAAILAFETELARASLTRVERREPSATDHPTTAAELAALAPTISWSAYSERSGSPRRWRV